MQRSQRGTLGEPRPFTTALLASRRTLTPALLHSAAQT